jgi:hypothetical protein
MMPAKTQRPGLADFRPTHQNQAEEAGLSVDAHWAMTAC